MAQYKVTFSCGHEGWVNITGPTKNREWIRASKEKNVCPDCYRKWLQEKREQENKESLELSKEMELPELTGTEKQVAWANTLRVQAIQKIDEYIQELEEKAEGTQKPEIKEKRKNRLDEIYKSYSYALNNFTTASFWIDKRSYMSKELIELFKKEFNNQKDIIEKELPSFVKEELTIKSDNNSFDLIVELRKNGNYLEAIYPKNETFKQIVKELSFSWSSSNYCWRREIDEYNGSFDDRAAELGNLLLNAGFTVQFPTNESKEMAINATFSKEQERWILWNDKKQSLKIFFERDSKIYKYAKMLPAAEYSNLGILVKPQYFKEIFDFAECYDFSFSKKAKAILEKAKEEYNRINCVQVEQKEPVEDIDKLEEILKKGGGIITDLMEDDDEE